MLACCTHFFFVSESCAKGLWHKADSAMVHPAHHRIVCGLLAALNENYDCQGDEIAMEMASATGKRSRERRNSHLRPGSRGGGSHCRELRLFDLVLFLPLLMLVVSVIPICPGFGANPGQLLVVDPSPSCALQVLCYVLSYACGSTFGTMGIVFPLVGPLAWRLGGEDVDFLQHCFACILGGSIFGNLCSPISDTTILSSLATGKPPLRCATGSASVSDKRSLPQNCWRHTWRSTGCVFGVFSFSFVSSSRVSAI